MKKIMVMACLVALGGFILSGCVMPYAPGIGYSNIKAPITSTGKVGGKVGTASCTNYVGVYTAGDASIEAAAQNGGIQRVHTVDYELINYSPFYIVTTTIVTGE
jgi:hypothetical protein